MATFQRGDRVRKRTASADIARAARWRGVVVGEYSTPVTSEGYAVMSTDPGSLYSVQVYPVGALEADYRPDETRWLVPPL